jgi:hypothetical protein
LITLTGCQTTDNANRSAELAKQFSPLLNGVWVVSDYIDDIAKTRSPLRSSGKLATITEMILDMKGITGDSTHIIASLGNHEGSDFILYFREGETSSSLLTDIKGFENKIDSYELGYVINNADTSLLLYRYNKDKKLLEKTKYIRSPKRISPENLGDGLQYLVNKKIMAGSYKITDSTGNETTVKFTIEGKTTGLKVFKTYFVLTDFVAASENATDEICFGTQTNDQKCYGFEFKGDTLHLFEPAKNEMDTLFTPGPSIYKFVKQD